MLGDNNVKLAWLTDVHLNFLDANERKKFYQEIINTRCDGVLVSGDIAEAPGIKNILQELLEFIEQPIYFVLGNHDDYRLSFCYFFLKIRCVFELARFKYVLYAIRFAYSRTIY